MTHGTGTVLYKDNIYVHDGSVADPGCLSRIPDPDFYPSRIQKQQQKRGVKKNLMSYLSM